MTYPSSAIFAMPQPPENNQNVSAVTNPYEKAHTARRPDDKTNIVPLNQYGPRVIVSTIHCTTPPYR